MKTVTIAIVEDQPLALKSILKKLEHAHEYQILFTAVNGLELQEKSRLQVPDVVLMDIEMPVMDGIRATQEMKAKYPQIKILMLTTFDDEDKIFRAILAGASGYILKDEATASILRSIREVYEGGAAMSPGIALKAINYIKATAASSQEPKVQHILSARETEILTELKNGWGYKQIADRLFISEGTVRKHIENIYRKLEVNNKVSAVTIAVNNKWL